MTLSNDHYDYGNGKQAPGNHTLEDVAEEVLNGMFCHYEPPDPKRIRKGRSKRERGILRTPKKYRKPAASPSAASLRSRSEKSVRWKDGVQHTTPRKTMSPSFGDDDDSVNNIQCNVVSSCIDAGVEVGIVSSSQKKQAEAFLAQYEVDQQKKQKEVVASIYKKRNLKRKDKFAVVFDDDGNLTSDRGGMPPPPPPPPPSRNEKFIPELCGVAINCIEDDSHLANLVSWYSDNSPSKQYRRPRQPYDYDDDESNSIISDSEREEEDRRSLKREEKAKAKLKAKKKAKAKAKAKKSELESESDFDDEEKQPARPRRRFLGRSVAAVPKKTNETDWEGGSNTGSNTNSNTSSRFRRMWGSSNRRKDNKFSQYEVEVDDEVDQEVEPPAVMKMNPKPVEMDPIEMNRFDCNSNPGPSPRKSPLGIGFLNRSPRNYCNTTSDWDESKPIVPSGVQASQSPRRVLPDIQVAQSPPPVQTSQPEPSARRERSKSPSRRWRLGGRGRKKDARDPSPGPIRRTRSQSREDRRRSSEAASSSRSKSPVKNRGRQSLDPSSMNRARSKSPLKNQIRGRQSLDPSSMNRGRSKSPLRSSLKGSFATDQAQQDAMERQSFITDHRRGFEGGVPAPPPQMIPRRSPMRPLTPQTQAHMLQTNPQMQAQTQVQMGSGQPAPQMQQGYQQLQPGMRPGQAPMQQGHPLMHPAHPLSRPVMRDDAMELQSFNAEDRPVFGAPRGVDSDRQSLITAHRQGFDGPPPPPPAPATRRPTASMRSQDDRLERQSDIMAHRQSFESQGNNGRMRGRSKSPRRESTGNDGRSNRSKSPERRSRSQDFSNDNPSQGPGSRRGRSMERINEAQPNQVMQQRQSPATYNQVMQQRQAAAAYNQAMQQRHLPAYNQAMQQPQPPVTYNQTMQQQYLPPTPEEPLVEQKEVAKPEAEMSWEEKTRLAWAVLRGDTSSLNLETPKADTPKTEDEANFFPGDGNLRRQSSSESSKKVTFGQDEIRLTPSREQLSQAAFFDEFEDNQDENQSISRPDKVVKKKKVFRGTKIIGDLFGRKNRNSPGKVKLSNSRSLDLTATATMSQDYSEGPMNSRSMESDYGTYNNRMPMQGANIGMYNGQVPVEGDHGRMQI
jgi:hypothetical protein